MDSDHGILTMDPQGVSLLNHPPSMENTAPTNTHPSSQHVAGLPSTPAEGCGNGSRDRHVCQAGPIRVQMGALFKRELEEQVLVLRRLPLLLCRESPSTVNTL